MSVQVIRAARADFFSVYRLLRGSTLNSRSLSLDARRRMFEGVWGGEDSQPGYVLKDNGETVGFLGTLCTQRSVLGEQHKFCEIHSWYVNEMYRNQSLLPLLPALSAKNVTFLNYTPTPSVYEIGKKFGFADLETDLVLLYPVPSRWEGLKIVIDKAEIPDYLSAADARIFYDHRDVECLHLVITRPRDSSAPLYLMVKAMKRRWYEPIGRLIYVSDPQAFSRVCRSLSWRLCWRFGWQCLVANSRDISVADQGRWARRIAREIPSQFKSRTLKAEDIKPIYTLPLLIGYRLH